MKKFWFLWVAVLAAFALLAAACGNDDDDGAESQPTAEEQETPDTDDGGDTSDGADTDDGTDDGADGADDGADTDDGGDGDSTDDGDDAEDQSGLVELGGGAVLDPSECPEEWDNTAGVSDDEIRIGVSGPRSGPLAGFGTITDGVQSYFDAVGPIDGRRVVIVDRDDAYDAQRTLTNIEEMIDVEDLLGFAGIIGSPNNNAVHNLLNDNCIPQLLNFTGLPKWGDPVNFPWTTGVLLSYNTEANIWCSHIVDEVGAGATVAVLYMSNDFGLSYRDNFETCAAEAGLEIVDEILHDPLAESVGNDVVNLAASDADVLILGTTGAYCPQSVATMATLPWEPLMLVSSTCQVIGLFWVPIGPLADGFRIVATTKDVADSAQADDEWVQFVRSSLEAEGIDPEAASHATGYSMAEVLHSILLDASAAEGGLNRTNLMQAAWQVDLISRSGIGEALRTQDGANDSYLIESGRIETYVWDSETGSGAYEPVSDLIEFEGETGTFGG